MRESQSVVAEVSLSQLCALVSVVGVGCKLKEEGLSSNRECTK